MFMEEPDKKEIEQEDAEKLGFSETDNKEVVCYQLLFLYTYFSKVYSQSRVPISGTWAGGSLLSCDALKLLSSVRTCFSEAVSGLYSRSLVTS